MRWKLIETYERTAYAGYTDLVLLGWDSGHPDGKIMFFGVGWLDQFSGRWTDAGDRKPWGEHTGPTHWLCSLRGAFEQDYRPMFQSERSHTVEGVG